ncbi:MAG: ABC transporter permease [Chloroflexi bacterium]|nr:ABC transporter permease [Chloroflexota bacterium]
MGFLHDGRAVAAGGIVALLVLVAVLAPVVAPHDPESIDPNASLSGPSADHWLGADQLGRDVVSRLMFGARLSLQISIESVTFAALVGITLGVLSSYFGGWIELVAMRVVDVLLVFPALVLAITVAAYLGRSVQNIALVIGIVYMPIFARLAYSVTAVTCSAEFVQAARAMGASHGRIILRAILPNSLAPLIVQVSLSLGFAILAESGLSFLGVGVPPPATSWGAEIAGARLTLDQDPLLVVWPSVVLGLAILSFNLLGDALRDVLDPRIRTLR